VREDRRRIERGGGLRHDFALGGFCGCAVHGLKSDQSCVRRRPPINIAISIACS
jgi:hypothetical protein